MGNSNRDRIIDFNGITTPLGLSYAKELEIAYIVRLFLRICVVVLKNFPAVIYLIFLSNTNNVLTVVLFQLVFSNIDDLYRTLSFEVIISICYDCLKTVIWFQVTNNISQ